MTPPSASTEQLITFNQIVETLNRSVDEQGTLNSVLPGPAGRVYGKELP